MFAYERLIVYQKAFAVNQQVYRFIVGNREILQYLRNQLGRASMSIMLNIAEGSGRKSLRERNRFFTIARGSAFECSSLISFLTAENRISSAFRDNIYQQLDEISRILYAMIRKGEVQ